ncbi:archease [Melioribacter sp. OK-6-Me]|uniref:archease n=1 Tax=unclassified Melioribacter TaxID=2627329 RepID=UPI003ED9D2B9
MPYKFIEHTADIAAEVSGNSITEIFLTAYEVWKETVVESYGVSTDQEKEIRLSAQSNEVLLVEFLSELNYFLFTKKWFCRDIPFLDIIEEDSGIKLIASLKGGPIEPERIKIEIKAVTFHNLKIEKAGDIFRTIIVFDI